jgi:hypothetical protein
MVRKEKDEQHGSGTEIRHFWLVCLGVFLLFPSISHPVSAEPPVEEDCLFFAYSSSFNHYFLIKSNSLIFGTNITVEHNCDSLLVFNDGRFIAESFNSSTLYFEINQGMQNLTFISNNNLTTTYNNVEFLPNALTWYNDWNEWQMGDYSFDELMEINVAKAQENWASFLTAVIIWILVVYVYWNLINSYVDRNYAEEVKR